MTNCFILKDYAVFIFSYKLKNAAQILNLCGIFFAESERFELSIPF